MSADTPEVAAARIQAEAATRQSMAVMLGLIAAVSLVVGGIGVMNVMLMTVRERTREIGIRMAIGAREWDILFQFLIEAVTLSVIGGVFGIAVGAGLIVAVGKALGWDMGLPLDAVVVAVGTSAAIGIIFGFFPARRAAQMDPISALRHE